MPSKSWEEFHRDIQKLAEKVSAWKPDIIAPCMIGGLVPAAIMAKQLGLNDVRPIDIERIGEERRLVYDVQGSIAGKKVLILEDDLPTGKGPALIKKQFEERGAIIKIAAVYAMPTSKNIADYYTEIVDAPPDYPYKKAHVGDRIRK